MLGNDFLKMFCCASERPEPVCATEVKPGADGLIFARSPITPKASSSLVPVTSSESPPLKSVVAPSLPSPTKTRSSSAENVFSPSTVSVASDASSMPVSGTSTPALRLSSSPNRLQRLLSRKSSGSMSSFKDGREFRLFLPILDGADTWINPEAAQAYSASVDALKAAFDKETASVLVDHRPDSYVLGKSYFALKYNEERRLEMRVRTESKPCWQEKWSKVRYGKKDIQHYQADILTYLGDVGYCDLEHDALLAAPRHLEATTLKGREYAMQGVSVELSELAVCEHQTTIDTAQVQRQRWLSVMVAGDSASIEAFVFSPFCRERNLWLALSLCQFLRDCYPDITAKRCFVPVISGHSLWALLVSGATSDNALLEAEPAVSEFLAFLSADESLGVEVKPFNVQ